MVNAPISIPLAISHSRTPGDLFKAQSLAADALKIERYINSQMAKEYIRQFDFAALAQSLSLDVQRVQSLLHKLSAGNQEITVRNLMNRPKTPGQPQPHHPPSDRQGTVTNNRRQCWPAADNLQVD